MELKEFVAESIKQIIDGVSEAKEYADKSGAKVNPERDVHNANTANSRKDSKTGVS